MCSLLFKGGFVQLSPRQIFPSGSKLQAVSLCYDSTVVAWVVISLCSQQLQVWLVANGNKRFGVSRCNFMAAVRRKGFGSG